MRLMRLIRGRRARVLGGTVGLALVLAVAAGAAEAANTGFVRAQGARFTLNGAPFYFVGTNAYFLMVMAAAGSPAHTTETMAMANQLGFTVLRAWAFYDGGTDGLALQPAPGVFNETAFRALDWVLDQADRHNVRLILPLVNGTPDYGGMEQYVRWCAPGQSRLAFYENGACRQMYQNYVRYVLTRVNTVNGRRYADDPTVFAWELANEPDLPDGLDYSGTAIRDWVAATASFIKSIDPNHMVGTGEIGPDTTTQGYSPVSTTYNNQGWLFNGIKGVSFTLNTAVPEIDFGSIHLYPEFWNLGSGAGHAWIADHARIARSLGKPLLLGEFGASQNTSATFDSWLATADAEQVAGSLVWQLMCQSCFGMRDQFGLVYPPASAASGVLAQAAARAQAKSGGAPVPPGPPAPPTDPPAPPGGGGGPLPIGVFVAAGNVDGSGADELVTGADGGGPHVRVFAADGRDLGIGFFAYDVTFSGGVRVAACDVTGDGRAEIITAAGPGGGPHVRVFAVAGTSVAEVVGFQAYDATFTGGVAVACGDVDGDGRAEIITGADAGGGPHVRVFKLNGADASELVSFFAFDPGFVGGVRVAAGDLGGDGRAEIVVAAGPGGGPQVRAFTLAGSGVAEVASFFAYDPSFRGGLYLAVGDVTGDGRPDIVTGAGRGGGPHVRVFTATGADAGMGFMAYDPAFAGGVRVATASLGAGAREIVTATGPGAAPHVRAFVGAGIATGVSFLAY